MTLEFGDYTFDRKGNPVPTIKSAFLDISDSAVELENLRAKIMGGSFVMRSDDVVIYARGLGDGQYRINTYILDGTGFNKISLDTVNDPTDEKLTTVNNESQSPELIVLTQQAERTYWKENYDISVRVYDAGLNETPEFHESFGSVEGADVSVIVMNEESEETLTELKGKTDSKGIWTGSHKIVENLTIGGKYLVDVTVSYMGTEKNDSLEMFVIADVSNSESN